jgi:hypothetical protein
VAVTGARVPNTRGRWGFVGETGKVVIEPRFTSAAAFSGGLALVAVVSGRVRAAVKARVV